MTLRTLKTEADYKEALAEIDGVFDAAPNTPEADRLDILALLIEACQEQHYPITAKTEGEPSISSMSCVFSINRVK